MRRAFFSVNCLLRHDFFSRQLAVAHALDACDPVVVGDVDGADALGVAAQRTDVADPQVDRDAITGHNQQAVFRADNLGVTFADYCTA